MTLKLIDPIAVRHQGVVVLLGRPEGRPTDSIYFNIRAQSLAATSDYTSFTGWTELPLTGKSTTDGTRVPPLLRIDGMSLLTVSPAAVTPSPADAPFRALSDQKHLYILRRSQAGKLYVNRFMVVEVPAPAVAGQDGSEESPAGYVLRPVWEVRYRRSELRDSPAGPTDSLGSRNMSDVPFVEPTLELAALPTIGNLGFDVLLTPDAAGSSARWQFFIPGTDANTVEAISFPRLANGLIDTAPGRTSAFTIRPLLRGSNSPLTVTAGVGATLYGEQEPADGSDPDNGSLKRAGRVMVTTPVNWPGGAGAFVADFGLHGDGTIGPWPAALASRIIDATPASSYPITSNDITLVGDTTLTTAVLSNCKFASTPQLVDGSDGIVHCYGAEAGTSSFIAARYAPKVQRATVSMPWKAATQSGQVVFAAQRAGSTMSGLKVTVSDTAFTDLCNIRIDYGSASGMPSELWRGVPRDVERLLATLNGSASGDAAVAAVRNDGEPYFSYVWPAPIARLPVGAAPTNGYLDLVSLRPDLPLAGVTVTAAGHAATVTLTYGSTGAVTVVWPKVTLDAGWLFSVLRGNAAPGTYDYTPGTGTTSAYALHASTGAVVLFSAAAVAQPVAVAVAKTPGDAETVKVTITPSGGSPVTVPDVPADQARFAAALAANPAVTSIFPVISAAPTPGRPAAAPSGAVSAQTTATPLDLRGLSMLCGALPPTASGNIAAGAVQAGPVQSHATDPASSPVPPRALGIEAWAGGAQTQGVVAEIQDGTSAAIPPDSLGDGAWIAAPPVYAVQAGPGGAISIPSKNATQVLRPGRGHTVEAWICPSSAAKSRLISFRAPDPGSPGAIDPDYIVGLTGATCLNFGSAGSGTSSTGMIQANPLFALGPGFTWEVWVKPAAATVGSAVQVSDPANPTDAPFLLGLDAQGTPQATLADAAGNPQTLTAASPVTANAWTHLAVTGSRGAAGTHDVKLYVDGVVAATTTLTLESTVAAPQGFVGGDGSPQPATLAGNMSELRYWSIARTVSELRRTLYTALAGDEPGLVGYWRLNDAIKSGNPLRNGCVTTGQALDAVIAVGQQSMQQIADDAMALIVAGVGGMPAMQAEAPIRITRWNHLAVVSRAGTGLRLNGANPAGGADRLDSGDCGKGPDLEPRIPATYEAWVQFPKFNGVENAILGRWGLAETNQAFWLGVAPDNAGVAQLCANVRLKFTDVEAPQPLQVTATSGPKLSDGKAHHVAVVLTSGTEQVTVADRDNKGTHTVMAPYVKATLYVDAQQVGTGKAGPLKLDAYSYSPAVMPCTSSASFTLAAVCQDGPAGAKPAIEIQRYLSGLLAGVRVSNVALTLDQLKASKTLGRRFQSPGAVAAWWFDEQAGSIAADSVGKNDARLTRSDAWTLFRKLGTLEIVVNGVTASLLTEAPSETTVGYLDGPTQVTLGAWQDTGGLKLEFPGQLDEVRIWSTALTAEQVRDRMYSPLAGDETSLVGYWRFEQDLKDATGRGDDGQFIGTSPPKFVPSLAPVSAEGPMVRDVYGQARNDDFQVIASGRPAVVEYSDTQRLSDGMLAGALKRGYFYFDGAIELPHGFFLGELKLTWLGQVQAQPTLIGFIEGPPPVPSENLSRPYYLSSSAFGNYFNASSVTLTQSETKTMSFQASRVDTVVPFDIAASLGINYSDKLTFTIPPFAKEFQSIDFKALAKYKGSQSQARSEINQYASTWANTVSDSIALRGEWEPAQSDGTYLNTLVGRRFLPANTGYALVESWTADVYAMSLNTTGAMVGRAVVPDPDIPPDRNIITFPMDPHYVKNGTLDGKVGMVNDPDYPGADFARGSYFRVEEAVLLKQQIEKRIAEADAAWENFDAVGRGKEANTDLGEPAARTPFDVDAGRARENLMNMYVWDANGGLHSETQQVSASRTTTVAGVFKSSHMGGASVDLKIGTVGPAGSFDFLAGAQLDVTVSKSETLSDSFGLAVTVVGDPLLQRWDPTANAYSADLCPGKVKDYRFASFYLAPTTANSDAFLKIIEPGWYYSSDPDAIALRSARIEGTPSWRVLHRVTYVSRVPPRFEQQPDVQSGRASGRLIDEQDNSWLIAVVLAELGAQAVTPGHVAAALAVVMNPPANGSGVYPPSKLSAYVPWWDDFLKKTRGTKPDVAALELLMRCQHDALAYLIAGLDSGQIVHPAHKTGARGRIQQIESPAAVHQNGDSAAPATPAGVGH